MRNTKQKLTKKITFESKLIISIFLKTSFYLGIAHEAKSQSQFAALFFKMFKKNYSIPIPHTHTQINHPVVFYQKNKTLSAKISKLRKVMKKKIMN